MKLYILWIISFFKLTEQLSCSTNLKQGPYQLKVPNQDLPNVTRLLVKVKKFSLDQSTLTMTIGYRSYWKSYCYNGGSLDKNTGCDSSLVPLPPNKEELSKWTREGKCEVCHTYEDAWGSDSAVCNSLIKPCNVWVESSEIEKRSTNNRFAYHTCELNWRCGFSSSKAPAHLKMEDGPKVLLALPNGTLSWNGDYFLLSGDTSVMVTDVPKIINENIEARCVEDKKNYWCIDPDTNQGFHLLESSRFACIFDTCYVMNRVVIPKKTKEDFAIKHASLEDLNAKFGEEMVNIEDLKYTVLQMSHRILMLENVLRRTTLSVAKIDDKLISNLLGGSFSTEFISDEFFLIRPCIKNKDSNSNCQGDKIFTDGRWVKNKNKANCINLNKAKEVNLFDLLDVWLPEIAEQKVLGTPDEYTGWSFFANQKDSLMETMLYTKNGGRGTSMSDLLSMPEGSLLGAISGLWGVSLTTIAVIVIIGFILCVVYKKL